MMIFIKEKFKSLRYAHWTMGERLETLRGGEGLGFVISRGLGVLRGNRAYSTDSNPTGCSVVPLVTYENADLQKMCIIKDSGGKTGVYR